MNQGTIHMRRRRESRAIGRAALALSILLVLFAADPAATQAQTVTATQLGSAALAVSDLNGYGGDSQVNGPLDNPPALYDSGFQRRFFGNGFPNPNLWTILLSPKTTTTLDQLQAAVQNDSVAKSALPDDARNPRRLDSLGIGDVDRVTLWSTHYVDGEPSVELLDVFLRGRITVVIRYGRSADGNIDQMRAEVRTAAYLQDQKLRTSGAVPLPLLFPPPAAPSNLRATGVDIGALQLDWTAGSTNEDGFQVLDGQAIVATTPAHVTSFTLRGLDPGSSHCLTVRAFNAGGASAASNQACAAALAAVAPAPPSGVRAVAIDSSSIRLTWSASAGAVDGYAIEDALTGSMVTTVDGGTTSFLLVGLQPESQYCSIVYAYNAGGYSDPSDPACAVTQSQ